MRRVWFVPFVLVAGLLVGAARSAPAATAPRAVALVVTPSGAANWVAFSDGRVWPAGSDAGFFGDASGRSLKAPIVGMAATPSGQGYWLVASDGGVFSYGDARFRGSAGALRLNRPVVGMAATPSGQGYWLVASDGGIFSYGDARFYGSAGAIHLARPIVGMAASPTGGGYWFVASDGGVFSYGDARFAGSAAGKARAPIVGMAASRTGDGYWLLASDTSVFAFGGARYVGRGPGGVAIARSGDSYISIGADGSRHGPDPSAACTIFPADNPWNTDIAAAPVNARSAAWVASIGATTNLHPDVGTAYGIPFVEVGAGQARVPVSFDFADESDPGPYPVPPGAPVEGGSDRHVLVVDRESCRLWELFDASSADGGASWHAGSGATWDLRSNALRPDGWTSADAAGLPIFPGLIRYDEVAAGHIDHALRFTIRRTQQGFIHPATHAASSTTDPNVPPMGARFRMKAGYDCSPYRAEVQVICTALKRYGMFVADNGSDWYLTGAPDRRWDDAALDDLKEVPGSAFEAVESGPVLGRS
jgi:hypothetical protein